MPTRSTPARVNQRTSVAVSYAGPGVAAYIPCLHVVLLTKMLRCCASVAMLVAWVRRAGS